MHAVLAALEPLVEPINRFFEGVLVMDGIRLSGKIAWLCCRASGSDGRTCDLSKTWAFKIAVSG